MTKFSYSFLANEKMLLFSRLNEIRAVYYDKVVYFSMYLYNFICKLGCVDKILFNQ